MHPHNGRSITSNVSRLRRAARRASSAPAAVSLPILAAGASGALAQGEVNIYSYREPQLIDPLLKAFTDKTGIKANVVYAAAGLNERLAAEGQNSPADLLFTVDAGRLSEAKDAGLTQPVDLDARSSRPFPPSSAIPPTTGSASPCARAWSTPPRSA